MRGVYVHVPFCGARCKYCAFVSCTDKSLMRPYVAALKREAALRADDTRCDTVYIGGGTPSVLYDGGLEEILCCVKANFQVEQGAEITAEANPDSITERWAQEAANAGVNRVSVGLQSADDAVLRAAGRIHTFSRFQAAIDTLRRAGLTNIGCDVMLGLQGQSLDSVRDTVKKIIDTGIPHVSVYALKTEEGTPLYLEGYFPDEDAQADMYEAAYALLKQCGYERYEVSNFCKDGLYSRHNTKYWQLADYIGLGAAAHSLSKGVRRENTEDIAAYIDGKFLKSEREIPFDERVFEYVMLSLRTAKGLDLHRFSPLFGYDFYAKKRETVDKFRACGLLERADNRLFLTENAFFVMNSILCELV